MSKWAAEWERHPCDLHYKAASRELESVRETRQALTESVVLAVRAQYIQARRLLDN